MSWSIQRRQLLTGAGAVFLLPMLERFFSKKALAAGTSDPLRFVSCYMPNGTYNVRGDAVWYPQGLQTGPLSASSFSSRSVFAPFTSELGSFSVLMHPACSARDKAASVVPDGGGHVSAITTFLSQQVFTDVTSSQCTVPGSSFDQMVADSLGKPNLVMSGGCNDANPDGIAFNYADYVSYSNGQPNEPHKNPVELYSAMFANLVSTPNAPVLAAARNHSILDSSLADIKDLQSKLGKTDNQKLDDYFTSIRDLETQIFTPPVVASACTPGSPPSQTLDNVDLDGSLSSIYDQRVQSFFDMVVLAFKCDLVRSVSFTYDGETCGRQNNPCPTNLLYDNADLTGQLHIAISHYGQNSNGDEKCISRDRNYLSLFFYLIDALRQATDPSGSPMLDNTIALAGFNVTDGQHTGNAEGTPLIVGGGKNLMHPGNCFDLKNADMKDLFYSFSTFLKLGWSNYLGSTNLLSIRRGHLHPREARTMAAWFRARRVAAMACAATALSAVLSLAPEARAGGKGKVVAVLVEGAHADQVTGWIEDRVNAPDTLREGDVFRSALASAGVLPLRLATTSDGRDAQLVARAQTAARDAGVDRAVLVDVHKTPRGTRVHVWQVDATSGVMVDSEVTLARSASAIEETRAILALGPRPTPSTTEPVAEPTPPAESPAVGVLGFTPGPDRVTSPVPAAGAPSLLSVEAALGAGTRHFSYVERITPALRPYALDAAPLATLSGVVYPLASTGVPVVRDLGVTGDYSRAFALASEDSTGAHVATTWQSFDVGATERIPLGRALVVNVSAGYGGNDFQFTQNLAVGAAALPSVAYRFVRIGGDVRVRLLSAFSAYGGGSYLDVLGSGYTAELFPRESVGGVEGHLGASYALAKNWEVSLSAAYTRMFYSFNPLPGDTSVAGGALDEQTRLLAGFSYRM